MSKFEQKFTENKDMTFWTRLKKQIKICNQTQEGVSASIEVPFGTFRKWMTRKTYPDAHEITRLAVLLKTTVEELVDGEAGVEYVRRVVHPKLPSRIAAIVEDLMLLDDNELDIIQAATHTAAETKKGKDRAGLTG
jgi:hypothetical protein